MNSMQDTVLVVDDNPSILKLVHRHLDSRVHVDTAQNCGEAMALLQGEKPIIAFIDIHLGDANRSGISLVEKIREDDATMPLCMLTGDRSPDALLDCLCAGANDYIWKGSLNPSVTESMDRAVSRLQDPAAPKGNPILDNSILQSRGLQPSHLKLLAEYSACNFPELPSFSRMQGISYDVISSRFYRIRTMLGIADQDTLVKLLKVARGYRGKMSCPPPSAF